MKRNKGLSLSEMIAVFVIIAGIILITGRTIIGYNKNAYKAKYTKIAATITGAIEKDLLTSSGTNINLDYEHKQSYFIEIVTKNLNATLCYNSDCVLAENLNCKNSCWAESADNITDDVHIFSDYQLFKLKDESVIAIQNNYNALSPGSAGNRIFVDVNGRKLPNKLGMDIFEYKHNYTNVEVPVVCSSPYVKSKTENICECPSNVVNRVNKCEEWLELGDNCEVVDNCTNKIKQLNESKCKCECKDKTYSNSSYNVLVRLMHDTEMKNGYQILKYNNHVQNQNTCHWSCPNYLLNLNTIPIGKQYEDKIKIKNNDGNLLLLVDKWETYNNWLNGGYKPVGLSPIQNDSTCTLDYSCPSGYHLSNGKCRCNNYTNIKQEIHDWDNEIFVYNEIDETTCKYSYYCDAEKPYVLVETEDTVKCECPSAPNVSKLNRRILFEYPNGTTVDKGKVDYTLNLKTCRYSATCPKITVDGKQYQTMFDVQGNCCEECQSKYQNNEVGKITCTYGSDKFVTCQHGKLKNGKKYTNAQKCFTYMKNSSTKIVYDAVSWNMGSASKAKKLAQQNPGKTYCYAL